MYYLEPIYSTQKSKNPYFRICKTSITNKDLDLYLAYREVEE